MWCRLDARVRGGELRLRVGPLLGALVVLGSSVSLIMTMRPTLRRRVLEGIFLVSLTCDISLVSGLHRLSMLQHVSPLALKSTTS